MAEDIELSEHAAITRRMWNDWAPEWVEGARRRWAHEGPCWGAWDLPDAELGILPDLAGLDAIDLGCGTGYWCAWMLRLGARPVGVDVSEAQLDTARELQREYGEEFPLLHASAESVPLPDASFDLALSEYGAALWCDPHRWIPEAHRLLRPGGRLIFLTTSVLATLCAPDSEDPVGETLERSQFGLRTLKWPESDAPEFQLSHSDMFGLLRRTGFEVEGLYELQAPAGEEEVRFYMPRGWARRWPSEEVWVARRPGG